MSFQIVTFKYELRDVTHMGGLFGYGGLLKGWYLLNSSITMDAHLDSMSAQGWNSPTIMDMPNGKMKIATFQKH